MGNLLSYLYEFGSFRLDSAQRSLLRDGEPVHLAPKAFDVLVFLVERAGNLVEKRELMEAVWPGLYVEEGNLSVIIHTLRRTLASECADQKYIETTSKRGYRFSAEVRLIGGDLLPPAESVETGIALGPLPLSASSISSGSENSFESPLPEHLPPLEAKEVPRRTGPHWLWIALVSAMVTLSVLIIKRASLGQESSSSLTVGAIHSLAVLPFTVIGTKTDDAYIGFGMADAVTTRLDNSGKIVVRPTSALEKYVGASRNPVAVGREQKVDAVLDGHIQLVGHRMRLTVQLIRVGDGAGIWGETVDENYTDIFAVQDAVSEEVAGCSTSPILTLLDALSTWPPLVVLVKLSMPRRGTTSDEKRVWLGIGWCCPHTGQGRRTLAPEPVVKFGLDTAGNSDWSPPLERMSTRGRI